MHSREPSRFGIANEPCFFLPMAHYGHAQTRTTRAPIPTLTRIRPWSEQSIPMGGLDCASLSQDGTRSFLFRPRVCGTSEKISGIFFIRVSKTRVMHRFARL